MKMELFEAAENLSQVDISDIIKMKEEFSGEFGVFPAFLASRGEIPAFSKYEDQFDMLTREKQISERAGSLLDATGLELAVIKDLLTSVGPHTGNDESAECNELLFNLRDGKQFVKYLESLKPELMTESQMEGLKEVMYNLSAGLKTQYDLNDSNDDRLLELIGNVARIIEECKRIGAGENDEFAKSYRYLEEALFYARKGCLKEFILAKDVYEFSFELYSHEYFPRRFLRRIGIRLFLH